MQLFRELLPPTMPVTSLQQPIRLSLITAQSMNPMQPEKRQMKLLNFLRMHMLTKLLRLTKQPVKKRLPILFTQDGHILTRQPL